MESTSPPGESAYATIDSSSSSSSAAPSTGAHMFVFTNAKSGMKTVDKERVNRIVYEMSKNSSYFKQAKLQDDKLDGKVAEMKAKLESLSDGRRAQLLRQADRMAAEFEAQRELDSVCLVVDMDMFYAAVEIRDRPELADKPVAVGGESMISTTNYHARLKGVRSAMPGFIGRKLCPELVFVKPDYEKYTAVAEKIRDIFREYDPRMRSYSLDEAYLNVTQVLTERLKLDEPGSSSSPGVVVDGEEGTRAAVAISGAGVDGDVGATDGGSCPRSGKSHSTTLGKSDGSAFSSGSRDCGGRGWSVEAGGSRKRSGVPSGGMSDEDEEEGRESGERVFCPREEGCRGVKVTATRSCMSREKRRVRLFEAARALAEEIRGRIRETTKLTASVGIGPNFMLAKVASDWNKPDGQMCIEGNRAKVLRFLHDLPVRKIGGVGKVQEKCLKEVLGVGTCGDLFRERAACLHIMTPHMARWLIKVSLGIASAEHDVATEQAQAAGAITRKQISKERTFGELSRPQDLLSKCREICEALAAEMASKGLEAKTVGLKVKTTNFQVRTLDSTGNVYVSSADELFSASSALLQREIRGAPGGKLRLRLMGVKASGFRGQAGAPILPGQGTLDGFVLAAPKTDKTEGKVEEDVGEEGNGRFGEQGRCGGPVATSTGTVLREKHGTSGDAMVGALGTAHDREAQRVTAPPSAGPAPALGARGNAMPGERFFSRSPSAMATPTQTRTPAPTVTSVACPVCGEQLGAASNAALNRHLDSCLGMSPTAGEAGAGGGGGRGFPSRWQEGMSRKRPKASAAGIERFLTSKQSSRF